MSGHAGCPSLLALFPASPRAAFVSTYAPTRTRTQRSDAAHVCRANGSRSGEGKGGSHFDKLIKEQGGQYNASAKRDAEEAALHAFWLNRGVREEAYRQRLVGMGASAAVNVSVRHSHHTLPLALTIPLSLSRHPKTLSSWHPLNHRAERNPSRQERDLYRNPDCLSHRLDRLQALFPGINVAEMAWKEPRVLQLPLKRIAAQLVSLRQGSFNPPYTHHARPTYST